MPRFRGWGPRDRGTEPKAGTADALMSLLFV